MDVCPPPAIFPRGNNILSNIIARKLDKMTFKGHWMAHFCWSSPIQQRNNQTKEAAWSRKKNQQQQQQ
jgi:hypothetical protein